MSTLPRMSNQFSFIHDDQGFLFDNHHDDGEMTLEMGLVMADETTTTTPPRMTSASSVGSGSSDESDDSSSSSPADQDEELGEMCSARIADTTTPTKPRKRPLLQRLIPETLRSRGKPLNTEEYAANREMTKTQERWNALTMLPPSLYCLYYLFHPATWINTDLVAQAQQEYSADPTHFAPEANTGFAGTLNMWVTGNESGCATGVLAEDSPSSSSSVLRTLVVWQQWPGVLLPPLTVVAVVLGTCVHMPFSFLYHWRYSHKLGPVERVQHWSRRMDHAMIHFAAAMYSYASSGSFGYFLCCALFNLDSARRHFLPDFRPRSNQFRVAFSVLAYSLPILARGDVTRFALFWAIMGTGGFFFSQYPIGGWSHAAFHVFLGMMPPVIMAVAVELPASQAQLKLAAQCTVWLQQQHLRIP